MGPLFGAVLARALDSWWAALGTPDPFTVVEAGAGAGRLARDILAAGPRCAPALRYLLVERSERLRSRQAELVRLEPAEVVLGGLGPDDPDEGRQVLAGTGPVATSLPELPAMPLVGVVLANELLDNLPFRLLERTAVGWNEVRVTASLAEVLVPAAADVAAEAERWAPGAAVGARIPLQHQAGDWLRRALRMVERGRVVVVDYADDTASLAARPWGEWVRTYSGHGPGAGPLAALGMQDVTCEVALDQLGAVRRPTSDLDQGGFLRRHGVDDLITDARAAWRAGAHVGDLAALKARSRVGEGAALLDPGGLGRFRVLEWAVPGPG